MLRQSTERRFTFSLSCAAAFSRLCSFMRQPSITFELPVSFAESSAMRPASSSALALLSSIWLAISKSLACAPAISLFMRSTDSPLLFIFARKTAARESQSAALASVCDRRSRALSASMSFSCMRSDMLPAEAYSASRLR